MGGLPHWTHTLRWRHNDHAGVSNHQPHGCLLNRLFRRKSKKTSKLRVTGLCAGNSPGTGEFPAQMASYAENVSIWWRHHASIPLWSHCSGGTKFQLEDVLSQVFGPISSRLVTSKYIAIVAKIIYSVKVKMCQFICNAQIHTHTYLN